MITLARGLNHFSFSGQLSWLCESTRVVAGIVLQEPLQLRGFARIDQAPQLLACGRLQIQIRGDAVEDLDVIYRDAIARLQIQPREDLRRESQHFQIGRRVRRRRSTHSRVACFRDAIRRVIAAVGEIPAPHNKSAEAAGVPTTSRRHARYRTGYVRTQRQQPPVVIGETKPALRLTLAHALFEQIVVID